MTDTAQFTQFVPYTDLQLEGAGFINPRTSTALDKASLEELTKSIKADGLRAPLVVHKLMDGSVEKLKYIIVSGQRRYKALEKIHADMFPEGIPCIVRENMDLLAAQVEALGDNIQRGDLSSYEITVAMEALIDGGMAQKDISKRLCKSPAWVSRYLGAAKKACAELREAWKGNTVPQDVILDLAELPKDKQPEALAEVIAERASGGKTAAGAASKKAKGKAKAAKAAKAEKGKKGKKPKAPKADDAPDKLSTKDGRYYATQLKAATKKNEPYAAGVRDGIMLFLGELTIDEIFNDKEVTRVMKEFLKSQEKPEEDEGDDE
jgi:ParB family chromosome partitioning protein